MGQQMTKEDAVAMSRLTSSQTRRDDGLLSPGTSVRGSEKAEGEEEDEIEIENEDGWYKQQQLQQQQQGMNEEDEEGQVGEGGSAGEEVNDEVLRKNVGQEEEEEDVVDEANEDEDEDEGSIDQLFIDMMGPSTVKPTSTPTSTWSPRTQLLQHQHNHIDSSRQQQSPSPLAQKVQDSIPSSTLPLTPFRPPQPPPSSSRTLRTYSRKTRHPPSSQRSTTETALDNPSQNKNFSAIATPVLQTSHAAIRSSTVPTPCPTITTTTTTTTTIMCAEPSCNNVSRSTSTPRPGRPGPTLGSTTRTTPSTMKRQTSTPNRTMAKQTRTPSSAKITRQTVPVTVHVLTAEDGLKLPYLQTTLPPSLPTAEHDSSSSSDNNGHNNENDHSLPQPRQTFTLNLHPRTPIHHIAGHAAQYMSCTLQLPVSDRGFETRDKEGIVLWDQETIAEAFQLNEVQIDGEAISAEASARATPHRGVEIDVGDKPLVYLVERNALQTQGREKKERLRRLSMEDEETERRRSRSRGRDSVCRTPSVSSSRRGSRAPSSSAVVPTPEPATTTTTPRGTERKGGKKKEPVKKPPRKTPSQRALEMAESWRTPKQEAMMTGCDVANNSGRRGERAIETVKEEPLMHSIEHEQLQGGDSAAIGQDGAEVSVGASGESTHAVASTAAHGSQAITSKSRNTPSSTKKSLACRNSATPKPSRNLSTPRNLTPSTKSKPQPKALQQLAVTPSLINNTTAGHTEAVDNEMQPSTQKRLHKADPYDIEAAINQEESSPRRLRIMSSAVRRLGSSSRKRSTLTPLPKRSTQQQQPASKKNNSSARQPPTPEPLLLPPPAPTATTAPDSPDKAVIASTPNARTPMQIQRQPSVTSVASLLPSSPTDHVAAVLAKGQGRTYRKTMSKPIIIEDSEADNDDGDDDDTDKILQEARDRFSMPSQSQTIPRESLSEVSLPWSAPPLRFSKEEDPFWPVRIVGRRRSDIIIPPSPEVKEEAAEMVKDRLRKWEQVDKSNVFGNLMDGAPATVAPQSPVTLKNNALPNHMGHSLPPNQAEIVMIDDNSSVEEAPSEDELSSQAPQKSMNLEISSHDCVISATKLAELDGTPRNSWKDIKEVPQSPDIDTHLPFEDGLPVNPLAASLNVDDSSKGSTEARMSEVEVPSLSAPSATVQYLPKSDPPVHESDILTPPSAQASKRRRQLSYDSDLSPEQHHPRKKVKNEDASPDTTHQDEKRRLRKEKKARKKARKEQEKARQEEERKRLALEEAHRKAKNLERIVSSPFTAASVNWKLSDDSESDQESIVSQQSSPLKRLSVSRQLVKSENDFSTSENDPVEPLSPGSSTTSEDVPLMLLKSQRNAGNYGHACVALEPHPNVAAEKVHNNHFTGAIDQFETPGYRRLHFDEWAFLESTLGLGVHSPLETHNRIHLKMMHAGLQDLMSSATREISAVEPTPNVKTDRALEIAAPGLKREKMIKTEPVKAKTPVQRGVPQPPKVNESKGITEMATKSISSPSERAASLSEKIAPKKRKSKKHKKHTPQLLMTSQSEEVGSSPSHSHDEDTSYYSIRSPAPSPKDLTLHKWKRKTYTQDVVSLEDTSVIANDNNASPDTSFYSIRSSAPSPKDMAVQSEKAKNAALEATINEPGCQYGDNDTDNQDADMSLCTEGSTAQSRISEARKEKTIRPRRKKFGKKVQLHVYKKLRSGMKQSKKRKGT